MTYGLETKQGYLKGNNKEEVNKKGKYKQEKEKQVTRSKRKQEIRKKHTHTHTHNLYSAKIYDISMTH